MYAIRINDDNTISTLVNQRIFQGYKLEDWFWFLTSPYYQGNSVSECTVFVEFTLPVSKKNITEKLIKKNEFYEGYVKYTLSSQSKITNESGVVQAKVKFMNPDGEFIKETSSFTIGISTTTDWHNDTQYDNSNNNNTGTSSGNSGNGNGTGTDNSENNCNCDSEEHIEKILSRTRPLAFNSVKEAETKLNSGEINEIYYGQAVIILDSGGKYLSYTVQKGINGYVVEPVDTVGSGNGLFWKEA